MNPPKFQKRLSQALGALVALLSLGAAEPKPVPVATAAAVVPVDNPAVPPAPAREDAQAQPALTDADLAPYLTGPQGELAQRHFDAGRYREALAALQKLPQSPQVRYLEALCLAHQGRAAEAAPRFVQLAAELPPLAGRCHLHAALDFEDAGDLAKAEAEYAAVEPGAVVWSEAQLGLARVRRERKDILGALEAIAPLANRPSSALGRDTAAEALVLVAQLVTELGDKEEAKAVHLKLWAEHPLAKISDAALEKAKALGLKEPPTEYKLTRAELLEEAHHNDQALKVLQPLVKSLPFPSPLGCKARFILGKAQRKERKHALALETLGPVVEQCTDPTLRARALYVAASSGSIVAPTEGVRYYELLATDFPDHPFADDALFFAADLEQKAGRLESAQKILTKLVESPAYRDGDFRAEGMFKLFWLQRLRGHADDGLGMLERIIGEYGATRVAESERAEYWRARTLVDLGRDKEGDDALEQLARAHPTSYYALLSRSRLAERAPARAEALTAELAQLPSVAPLALHAGKLAQDLHFQAALELHRLGLADGADDELLAVERSAIRDDGDALRLLVQVLSRSGAARAAQQIARTELASDLSGPFTPVSLQTWMAAYPQAFRPLIQRSCAAAKIEPDLFQALVREESALDPRALSWAGAVGLSQLMPSTAKSLARQLGIKGPIDNESLMQPEINVTLGSTYVGQLLKKFNGNPALALAAYNAGAGAVSKWLSARSSGDLDAFVEEIPIAETRGYVKRVLQSYNVYQLLYARSASCRLPHGVTAEAAPKGAGRAVASKG